MPTTTTHEIDYPDGTSAITPLESHFEALAVSADEALTALKANIRGANSTATIASLATDIDALDTRLALNLQYGAGAPTGAPSNSGVEGSMYWDSTNDKLYTYTTDLGWKIVWEKAVTTITTGILSTYASAEWAINSYSYTERNGIAMLTVSAKRKGGTLSGGNITNENVFNINSGYRPISNAPGVSGSSGPLASSYLSSGGIGVITAIGTDLADEADIVLNYTYIKE
jgi:hypothetical protein